MGLLSPVQPTNTPTFPILTVTDILKKKYMKCSSMTINMAININIILQKIPQDLISKLLNLG